MSIFNESDFAAMAGVLGAAVGGTATIAASMANKWFQERLEKKRDEPRRALLREMLNCPRYEWRSLNTLMHVIGSDEDATKRLLLEVGARASEDGKPLWGLISRNPLPDGQ